MKTLKEISGDSLEQMIDYKVVDQDGDSVGTLHSLWSDPTTGAVEFLGVKTGWLFGQNHVVPAEKAELDESQNVVRLPYTSLFVKDAPAMSADAEISESEEENIYRYYGLDSATGAAAAGQAVSAGSESDPNSGATTGVAGGEEAGVSRLRRTVRADTAGTKEDPTSTTRDLGGIPTAGAAVRGALDSLVPGDSSSTSTLSSSAAAPGSFGTANLYGSTGTATPVEADATGTSFDTAATTSTSGATAAGPRSGDSTVTDRDATL